MCSAKREIIDRPQKQASWCRLTLAQQTLLACQSTQTFLQPPDTDLQCVFALGKELFFPWAKRGISETTGSHTAELLLFTETWWHLDQRRLSSWHLIPPQPSIYLDSLCQGWPWADKFSSYYLFTRIKEIYEDTNFHYLVKIKFCKITGLVEAWDSFLLPGRDNLKGTFLTLSSEVPGCLEAWTTKAKEVQVFLI